MKTAHKVLHEVLTPEEYKNLCRLKLSSFYICDLKDGADVSKSKPSHVLYWCFDVPPSRHSFFNMVINRLSEIEDEKR